MTAPRPDVDSPPPPRHHSGEWPPAPALVQPQPEPSRWSGEAIVGAVVGGITLLGSLLALAGHAYVISDHVAQLERDRDSAKVQHEAYEQRMRTIETTAQNDRAAADKRESLIEKSLQDIGTRLDAIQAGVEQLNQHHH